MISNRSCNLSVMALTLLLGLFLLASAGKGAQAQEIEWKAVHAWSKVLHDSQPLYWFEEMVKNNHKLQGKLRIKILGGPEVIGPFDQLEAIQKGVVQVVLGAAGYWAGAIAINNYVTVLSPYDAREEREKGVWDFMNEVNRRLGVHYLTNVCEVPMVMCTYKPIKNLSDLKGLKIRTSPSHISIIEGVGALPVKMASSEIYTALERGVLDGFCISLENFSALGLIEVAKYIIDHPFYKNGIHLFVRLDSWNQLPPDLQREVTEISKQMEAKSALYFPAAVEQELKKLKATGAKFVKLPGNEGQKFIQIAYDRHWARAFKEAPEDAARLRKLYGLPPWAGQ